MNKYKLLIILLLGLFIIGCRPSVLEPIPKEEQTILAFPYKATDVPLKVDNGFLFVREDLSLVNINTLGESVVLSNFESYFPSLSDEFNFYDYFHLKKSSKDQEFLLYSIIENTVLHEYTNAVFLKMDEFGNVGTHLNVEILPLDSIFPQDSSYNREFIDLNTINNSFWIAFGLVKAGPQKTSLEFIKYSFTDSMVVDTVFKSISSAVPLKIIQENNIINVFNQTISPQGLGMNLRKFDEDFNVLDSIYIDIPAIEINFTKILSSGNFLISGIAMPLLNEQSIKNNFLAEISPQGQLLWYKNKFSDDYLFYYDMIEQSDGFVACGYFSTTQEYPLWSELQDKIKTAYFVGYVSKDIDTLALANTSEYGASAALSIKKTDYGYALLNYMSFNDEYIAENYLWLYKLNEKLRLIN